MNILSIIIAVLIFGFLIFIHEFGHFIAARKSGITVLEFAIGMGPVVFKKEKGGVIYSLRAIPLGGFCQMLGEDDESAEEGAFGKASKRSRFAVLVAGSFMNLLAGFILLIYLTVSSGNVLTTQVSQFREGANPSMEAGMQMGDKIVALNKTKVNIANDISMFLLRSSGEPVDITVIRDGKKVVLDDISFPCNEYEKREITGNYADEGVILRIYYADFYVTREEPSFFNVPKQAFYEGIGIVKAVWLALVDLVAGNVPVTDISGPVGVTDYIGTASKQGLNSLLTLIVFITINLGVVNLLPLPALDGGRILFLLIEAVLGKPVPAKYEAFVHFAGFVLLIGFSIFITYQDVLKIIKR